MLKMVEENKILFTGGGGLLGTEMKKILPNLHFPNRNEFDVYNYPQMQEYLQNKNIDLLIHAAAFTSPPRIDKNPIEAINSNIIGTANIVRGCLENNIKLIYVSTDYVFRGDKGNYSEDDSVFPVNKYAWSKLGGECAVRMYDNSLIIRTSFGENGFPYEKAFIDQYTSRLSVSNLVKKIIPLLNSDLTGTINLGSKRRTVMEYAKSLDSKKQIGDLSINEINFKVPKDTSLNCDKYNKLFGGQK